MTLYEVELTREHRFRLYSDLDEIWIWILHCVAGKKYVVKILAAVKEFKMVKIAFKVWKFTLLFDFVCLTTFFHC